MNVVLCDVAVVTGNMTCLAMRVLPLVSGSMGALATWATAGDISGLGTASIFLVRGRASTARRCFEFEDWRLPSSFDAELTLRTRMTPERSQSAALMWRATWVEGTSCTSAFAEDA